MLVLLLVEPWVVRLVLPQQLLGGMRGEPVVPEGPDAADAAACRAVLRQPRWHLKVDLLVLIRTAGLGPAARP